MSILVENVIWSPAYLKSILLTRKYPHLSLMHPTTRKRTHLLTPPLTPSSSIQTSADDNIILHSRFVIVRILFYFILFYFISHIHLDRQCSTQRTCRHHQERFLVPSLPFTHKRRSNKGYIPSIPTHSQTRHHRSIRHKACCQIGRLDHRRRIRASIHHFRWYTRGWWTSFEMSFHLSRWTLRRSFHSQIYLFISQPTDSLLVKLRSWTKRIVTFG